MGFASAVRKLNEIKKSGLIREYAIGGAYAVSLYAIPQATYDLDVFVIVDSKSAILDLSDIYDYFRKSGARIENEYIFIEDMPVQFLANLGPLYNDAVENAMTVEYEGLTARFVDLEHLIMLLLTSYRPKDKLRLKGLIDKADTDKLLGLIGRFDNEKDHLSERYEKILGRACQGEEGSR